MNTPALIFRAFLFSALMPGLSSTAFATPPTADPVKAAKAVEVCETDVGDDVRQVRGAYAARIEFAREQRSVRWVQGDEFSVQGSGRYLGAKGHHASPFTYRCSFDSSTGLTNGVVFSDKGAPATPVAKDWQPDLTRLSPESCETAVASHLKSKYPRVGRIAFGSDSRQLKPGSTDETSHLEGQGGVERAPGMNAVPFSYRCEFDDRTGKVVRASTSE